MTRLLGLPHDVGARHGAEFFRANDAGKAHEILDSVFVDAPGVGVAEVGEPLDLGRHVGEAVELGGGQQPGGARGDFGRKMVGGFGWRHGVSLLLIKFVIKSKLAVSRREGQGPLHG